MFAEVLSRLGDLRSGRDPPPRRASNFISGSRSMPVTFATI